MKRQRSFNAAKGDGSRRRLVSHRADGATLGERLWKLDPEVSSQWTAVLAEVTEWPTTPLADLLPLPTSCDPDLEVLREAIYDYCVSNASTRTLRQLLEQQHLVEASRLALWQDGHVRQTQHNPFGHSYRPRHSVGSRGRRRLDVCEGHVTDWALVSVDSELNIKYQCKEPRGRRVLLDEASILAQPINAMAFGSEDYLNNLTTVQQHLKQLHEHLCSSQSLRGLSTYVNTTLLRLLQRDAEQFALLVDPSTGHFERRPTKVTLQHVRRLVEQELQLQRQLDHPMRRSAIQLAQTAYRVLYAEEKEGFSSLLQRMLTSDRLSPEVGLSEAIEGVPCELPLDVRGRVARWVAENMLHSQEERQIGRKMLDSIARAGAAPLWLSSATALFVEALWLATDVVREADKSSGNSLLEDLNDGPPLMMELLETIPNAVTALDDSVTQWLKNRHETFGFFPTARLGAIGELSRVVQTRCAALRDDSLFRRFLREDDLFGKATEVWSKLKLLPEEACPAEMFWVTYHEGMGDVDRSYLTICMVDFER